MYDIRDAQAAYQQATVEWRNSRFSAMSTESTLHEYKRAAAFIPELIDEINRLRAELKQKREANG